VFDESHLGHLRCCWFSDVVVVVGVVVAVVVVVEDGHGEDERD
jgi:hypothetical protein